MADEHVILVAFQVNAPTRLDAEMELTRNYLPEPGSALECWWVAEDDRRDGSDNDSAIFVPPGAQHAMSALVCSLYALAGLGSRQHNVVKDRHNRFEQPDADKLAEGVYRLALGQLDDDLD